MFCSNRGFFAGVISPFLNLFFFLVALGVPYSLSNFKMTFFYLSNGVSCLARLPPFGCFWSVSAVHSTSCVKHLIFSNSPLGPFFLTWPFPVTQIPRRSSVCEARILGFNRFFLIGCVFSFSPVLRSWTSFLSRLGVLHMGAFGIGELSGSRSF